MITPKPIEDYCINQSSPRPEFFSDLAKDTLAHAPQVHHMQVGALEGAFLEMLVKLTQAKTILEFGTFTGNSSLCFARALANEGRVTTLDRDPNATKIAQKHWEINGFSEKIELILGDARMSVKKLQTEIEDTLRPHFDLAFIDADKSGYPIYFEAAITLLRTGGLIVIDNVLWSGAVLNPKETSDHTIHAFNEKLKSDSRVEVLMLPVRDGMTLARIL